MVLVTLAPGVVSWQKKMAAEKMLRIKNKAEGGT